MKFRLPLLILAILVPLAVAGGIVYIALPKIQNPAKNTNAILELPANSPRKVPEKLEDARKMAVDRLVHLQKLTQAEWDLERKTIMYKSPPENIDDAIARTQSRIAELNQMDEAAWKKSREAIIRAEQQRLKK